MTPIKVWNGSAFVDVENVSYWNGSAWATAEAVHQWDGSAWEKVWPGVTPVVPTFVAAAMNSGTSTSLAINAPAGTTDGDEMLSLVANLAFAGPPTDPSGWVALGSGSDGAAQGASSRRTASSEPASYTWTGFQSGQANRGVNLSYRNVGVPYDDSFAVNAGSSVSAPSVTVAGANDIVVAVGIGTAANVPNVPSGFTSVFSAAGVRISVATPGIGATGSVSMTGFGIGSVVGGLFAMSPS